MAKAVKKVSNLREVPGPAAITSMEDLESQHTEAARLQTEIDTIEARLNEEQQALNEERAAALNPLKERQAAIVDAITGYMRRVEPSLDKKTITLACGAVSIRDGAEVVTFAYGANVETVAQKLLRFPTLAHLVETKLGVAKDKLRTEIPEKLRARLGFYVMRCESSVTIKYDLKKYQKWLAATGNKAAR
jgi:phage host-nuclease inhibitor protein Gam